MHRVYQTSRLFYEKKKREHCKFSARNDDDRRQWPYYLEQTQVSKCHPSFHSFVRSLVRLLVRLSLFHCHQRNDTRLYSCVVIYVDMLVRWESGTNGCSRPRTIHREYNHLSHSIFPSLFHECISHACSLRRRRGAQWRQQQSVIEPWCVSFYASYIWYSAIGTPTSSTITELYYYDRYKHVYSL